MCDDKFLAEIDAEAEVMRIFGKVVISGVPILGSVVSEILSYIDSKQINRRFEQLEKTVLQLSISSADFLAQLDSIKDNEHKYYAVRKNMRTMCVEALPETVDLLNVGLIELIMSEEYDMAEHACEIIQRLNAADVTALNLIREYKKIGIKSEKNYRRELNQEKKSEQSKPVKLGNRYYEKQEFVDRNIDFKDNTIHWSDFSRTFNANLITDPTLMLLREDPENAREDWHFILRSLLKLQSEGVLIIDNIMTLGNSSTTNIDRFHVTRFGNKLLSYLDSLDVK